MQIKDFLEKVCSQIKYKPIRKDISEELEIHIQEAKENYIEEGLTQTEAEQKAVEIMGNAEEVGRKLNKIHKPKLDWKLLLIVGILLCFGFLVVLTRIENGLNGYVTQSNIGKYFICLIIGLTFSIVIYFINYTKITKYSNLLYLIATILIIFSLCIRNDIGGIAHLRIGAITFSPTVIAVPLYIISFVGFINNLNKESKLEEILSKYINRKINIELIKIIVLSMFSLLLLSSIPSISSALILGTVYLIITTTKINELNKNKLRRIAILWGTVIVLVSFLFIQVMGIYSFRWNRLAVTLNPEIDSEGGGWLALNREKIIESANMFGEARNKSEAINMFDEGTEFAFISLLAHHGWVVSISIIIAVLALSIKLIINAIKIKDNYGKLLIIGIASMYMLQSILNILMNLNLWIESSFNLPFISYGGANLVVNMMSLALILSIYRRKDIIILTPATYKTK